ncbi:MAG TPA: SCO family protein [Pyrinomonadaceae bacterium]|nr:SCO family protein [Pyrinomonadaceae bacterium]
MRFKVSMICAVLICAGLLVSSSAMTCAQSRVKAERPVTTYSCPMHKDVTSRKPGRCPKCGMTLRPVVEPAVATNATESGAPNAPNSTAAPARIPDVPVLDQNGKHLNFYSDLVKGKVVAINFIFTTCTTICPPLTATFRRVQQELSSQSVSAKLISVSVDPVVDTPERLRDFAAKFKADPDWTFVTGEKSDIDALLRALGVAVADKNDHTPMVLVGNDLSGSWTRTYGLSSPAALVKVIVSMTNSK